MSFKYNFYNRSFFSNPTTGGAVVANKNTSQLSLEDYGIAKGSIPTFSAFQSAWNQIQSDAITQKINNIYIPECQVTTTSRLDINVGYSGIFDFDDNCKIIRNHTGECFRQQGTVITTSAEAIVNDINSTSNAQFTANTPTELQQARLSSGGVARLGLAVDDYIAIICNTKFTNFKSPNDGMFGNLRRVRSLSGDNILIQPLYRQFTTANNARVLKLGIIRGATIQGGNFTDTSTIQSTSFLEPFIKFALCESPCVRNSYLHDIGGKCIEFSWVFAGKAHDNEIRKLADNEPNGQFGYGVSTAGGCLQCVVQRNQISQTRHGYTTDRCFLGLNSNILKLYGESESILVDSNTIFDNSSNAVDTHEEGWGITISNNVITGGDSGSGIYIRSKSCVVNGNTVTGATSYGIFVSEYGYDTIVSNNKILRTIRDQSKGFGGYNIQALTRCQITNNFLSNAIGDIIMGTPTSIDGIGDANIRVIGNNLQSNTGITIQSGCTNAVIALNTGTCSNVFIQEDAATTGTRLFGNVNFGSGTYSLSGTNRTQLGNAGLPDTGIIQAIRTITANTTLTLFDTTIICNPSGAITITLPTATGNTGRTFILKNVSSQTITIAPNGSETTEVTSLSANAKAWIQSDGSKWLQIV